MSTYQIGTLFERSPTRELEEVQKINERKQAENDVNEFYETNSAQTVLTTLGDIIETYPNEDPRFLYIAATFGSGKTHLLKLIGFATETDAEFADLGDELANQWSGFHSLKQSIERSHVDRLKPVFLNLLNRDAAKEPPLPYLIYEAIGSELGYPTDPNWLLEWAWELDMNYDDCWEQVQAAQYDGKQFQEVLETRAEIRSWLSAVLPTIETSPYDTSGEVRESIEAASTDIDREAFDPSDLVERINQAQTALSTPQKDTELLIGLDEVALFIGKGGDRYREFQQTMEALTELATGPNPPVIGTGQYPLTRIHNEFEDSSVTSESWYGAEEPLEGADTEIIVRKRWLQKTNRGREIINQELANHPDLDLNTHAPITEAASDPVESYPLREYDLSLLRQVLQQLIPQGRITEEEYVQGRALLILVRSLFTRFDWENKSVGTLVRWDELYDLVATETTYIPLWVEEMMENKLIPSVDGGETAFPVRVAKALYLLNQVRSTVPSTPANLSRLLLDDTDTSLAERADAVESALNTLVADQKVLTETNDHGDEEYILVSEEQEDILTRAQTEAQRLPTHRLSATLKTYLQESDDRLFTAGSRHEVNIAGQRLVPLRFNYSILDQFGEASSSESDAVKIRIVADRPETVADAIETWQGTNNGGTRSEHVLVAIEISESMIEQLRNTMGMAEILSDEIENYPDLESDNRKNERGLKQKLQTRLADAEVYTHSGGTAGRYQNVFEQVLREQVQTVFGETRYVLTDGITEVTDAKQMAAFFSSTENWPLSIQDATMLGVDTQTNTLADGWTSEFIKSYEGSTNSLRAADLLDQTTQPGSDYYGTPRESVSALLITLATAGEIAIRRDGENITVPGNIGRAVRNKTNLTDVQIRFDPIEGDPEQIRRVIKNITGRSPDGTNPDVWLETLSDWLDEHSRLTKDVLRGIDQSLGTAVSIETLDNTVRSLLEGQSIEPAELADDTIEAQAKQFDRAKPLFRENENGETLVDRFETYKTLMEDRYPTATVTSDMLTEISQKKIPDPDRLQGLLDSAETHRQDVLSKQYARVTGEPPANNSPTAIISNLCAWLSTHNKATQDMLNRIEAEFDDVSVDDLKAVCETAWNGNTIPEKELVRATVRRQAEQYDKARQLLDASGSETSLWVKLQDAVTQLADERPSHPTTLEIKQTLEKTEPPAVKKVERLLTEAEDPFEIDERLEELAEELQHKYPDDDITEEIVSIIRGDSRPDDQRLLNLIKDAERVLAGVDEQLRKLREITADLDDGSVVVIESPD